MLLNCCLFLVCDSYCQVKFKLSFIVIPLHVWTYSGTKCRASQDHGATWIQTYINGVNSVNLYTTNLLTKFNYTYAIYKNGYLYINKTIQTVQLYKCFANTVHARTSWVKQLAGEEWKIVFSAWACKHTYITESFVGLCTHSSVWKVSCADRGRVC